MTEYLVLMHAGADGDDAAWGAYLAGLRASGRFDGGSAIGSGVCVSKTGAAPPITAHLVGYLRIRAHDLDDAVRLLAGNPVYEAGGVVELRALPRDG
ncbi:MAG: hypothetical protein ABMB14_41230 [Myxococcota bacterium]